MPYQLIEMGDSVKDKKGKTGVVSGIGNPMNPQAHFFVTWADGSKTWVSRAEIDLVNSSQQPPQNK